MIPDTFSCRSTVAAGREESNGTYGELQAVGNKNDGLGNLKPSLQLTFAAEVEIGFAGCGLQRLVGGCNGRHSDHGIRFGRRAGVVVAG